VIPIGDTVTLQVIADGFQTYGQVYKIDKLNMAMEVRMNRPTQQYSTYKDSAKDPSDGSGKSSGSSPDSKPSSPPPTSGSSPGQSDPQSNPSQSQPSPK
jgi:hypothetical protein